jgi:hypothetical protein
VIDWPNALLSGIVFIAGAAKDASLASYPGPTVTQQFNPGTRPALQYFPQSRCFNSSTTFHQNHIHNLFQPQINQPILSHTATRCSTLKGQGNQTSRLFVQKSFWGLTNRSVVGLCFVPMLLVTVAMFMYAQISRNNFL